MTPSQLSAQLRHLAAKISNSKSPRRDLVARDLKNLVSKISADTVENSIVIVTSIYWLEPDEGSDRFIVDGLSFDELKQIQTWVKNQAKDEYGITIPSIRITKVKSSEVHPAILSSSIEDFASSIRYDTGEGIYTEDNPIFEKHGIVRS